VTAPASSERSQPRWPAWYGFAALGLALLISVVAGGVLYAFVRSTGAQVTSNSAGLNVGATLIQDAALVGCAIWLASRIAPPRPAQFGLRGTPIKRAIAWALLALALYLLVQLIYVAAVNPHEKQTTLKDLGAGSGPLATVAIGVLVVGVAPATEEFFFRGFFYGSLRTHFTFLPAALIDGIVFGAVHAPTGPAAVPPLIALGFAFCMAYEATGSIFPTIALHALNNMVAFGADKQGSWAVGGAVAGTVIAACVALPRTLRARPVTA
jgi:uncharacterized protein